MIRRLSGAAVARHYACVSVPSRRLASEGSVRRISCLALEVEVGDRERLGVRRLGEHEPPRVDDHRAPAGAVAGRVLADLVGGDHERLVLDRAGAQQDLPVLARGGERERGGHGEDARAAGGELAVELGEAQVVTDAQAQLDAVGGRREHDLVARLVGLRLAVDAAADLDVEHVDLAVGRARPRRRGRSARRCCGRAWRRRPARRSSRRSGRSPARARRPRPRSSGGAVDRLGARGGLLGRAEHRPLLGQHDERRAGLRGGARSAGPRPRGCGRGRRSM